MNENDIKEIVRIVKDWIDLKKIGSIQINFFKGGISNVNLSESRKLSGTTKQ